ncbi:MAG: dihydrodipicolinate reductase [Deltaproteobacteria bacterium]|nr:dihydrodipicolinate reductase [Deltaproteobacteria bacterium]
MEEPIGVVQYGLGPIGQAIVKDMRRKRGIRVVGAIDIDQEKVGADLGELVGEDGPLGVRVSSDSREVLSQAEARLVVLSTVSSLTGCYPQIEEVLNSRKYLISTCEELAYPWLTRPDLAREIDGLAKKNRVALLGTGVNPGFAMDYLPIVVSGICRDVERIRIFRIQDASVRRLPFQRKIGVGVTPEEFDERRRRREIRHVGLTESIHMIARGFGWDLDRTVEEIHPVLAEGDVESPYIRVSAGDVKGMRQIGRGLRDGQEKITLEMVMALGQEQPRDVVEIEGAPPVRLVFEGGIHGDIATAAVVVNSIPRVLELPPGLKTMLDMPPVRFYE